MLDTTTAWGRLADRRLREEQVIWLTTVRRDGQPQPTPVWFLWDGRSILIYAQPNQQKLRNIRHNPRVSLHLNTDARGDSVVRIDGVAELVRDGPPATAVPQFTDKYRAGMQRIGTDPEDFARDYSVAIRVVPQRFYGW
ncbi:MAG: TIGR03667 family PPOX class F420-dependent oxidoreductase [Sphaerobacter sp.]|nr:TIGR03667 family PPOX class F420-dependent oxidoreductase [Sphaerobacter sp.]